MCVWTWVGVKKKTKRKKSLLRDNQMGMGTRCVLMQMSIKKKEERRTYLADVLACGCIGVRMHWHAEALACGCIGMRRRWRADVLACGCVGVRMCWRADVLVSRRG